MHWSFGAAAIFLLKARQFSKSQNLNLPSFTSRHHQTCFSQHSDREHQAPSILSHFFGNVIRYIYFFTIIYSFLLIPHLLQISRYLKALHLVCIDASSTSRRTFCCVASFQAFYHCLSLTSSALWTRTFIVYRFVSFRVEEEPTGNRTEDPNDKDNNRKPPSSSPSPPEALT